MDQETLSSPSQPIDPRAEIEALRQTAMAMGANDQENEGYDAIQAQLRSGEVTVEEAIRSARSILEAKQGYH